MCNDYDAIFKEFRNEKGVSIDSYYNILNSRSDMSDNVIHLTKPTQNEIDRIVQENNTTKSIIEKINYAAVDNLLKILKEGKINASTSKGFIVKGDKRGACCFQNTPFKNINENVINSLRYFINSKYEKMRYCGVGIGFKKFYVYQKGGRPVIYEKTEIAKKILKNENEYWRIVNLDLDFKLDFHTVKDDINKNIIFYRGMSSIVDFTYEREWRVPDKFEFNIKNDFDMYNPVYFIFPNMKTYNYFLEILYEAQQDKIFENKSMKEIYQDGAIQSRTNVENSLGYTEEQLLEAIDFDERNGYIIDEDLKDIIPNRKFSKCESVDEIDYIYRVIILDNMQYDIDGHNPI